MISLTRAGGGDSIVAYRPCAHNDGELPFFFCSTLRRNAFSLSDPGHAGWHGAAIDEKSDALRTIRNKKVSLVENFLKLTAASGGKARIISKDQTMRGSGKIGNPLAISRSSLLGWIRTTTGALGLVGCM